MADLQTRFPALAGFLGAYFPDAALEGRRTDEEIVAFFVSVTLAEDLQATRAQLDEVLALPVLPTASLARLANRRLDSESAAREWLAKLRILLGERAK